jgi:hypothetical protein
VECRTEKSGAGGHENAKQIFHALSSLASLIASLVQRLADRAHCERAQIIDAAANVPTFANASIGSPRIDGPCRPTQR